MILPIITGVDALDELLNGGIEIGGITNVYGRSFSGKTLLMHHLTVNCQLPQIDGSLHGNDIRNISRGEGRVTSC